MNNNEIIVGFFLKANCYMFFFEENIIKQIINSGGLYVRYIDDIFIAIN